MTQLDSSRKCSTAGHNRRKVTSCFCCGLRAAVLPRCYKIQKYVHSKERKPGAAHFWWKCTTFISEEGLKYFRSTRRHWLKVKRLNACKCADDRKTSALRVCQKPQTAGEKTKLLGPSFCFSPNSVSPCFKSIVFYSSFYDNFTIRESVQHCVFLVFDTSFRPQVLFVHSYKHQHNIRISARHLTHRSRSDTALLCIYGHSKSYEFVVFWDCSHQPKSFRRITNSMMFHVSTTGLVFFLANSVISPRFCGHMRYQL